MSSTGTPIGQGVGDQALAGLLLQQVKRIADILSPPSTNATRQVLKSGTAATYTTPTNQVPTQLRIRMWGAGAGGGGSATSGSGNAGGNGGDTIWDVGGTPIHAGGGQADATGTGGAGGSSSTGTAALRLAGAAGTIPSSVILSATTCHWVGGCGGGPGGGPGGQGAAAATAGNANTGGGGGSGGIATAAFGTITALYGGGGAGEYVEIIVNNPAATYTFTIGAAGTAGGAGTGGVAGAAGGTGLIVVDELYT